jgi:hypothetical protein
MRCSPLLIFNHSEVCDYHLQRCSQVVKDRTAERPPSASQANTTAPRAAAHHHPQHYYRYPFLHNRFAFSLAYRQSSYFLPTAKPNTYIHGLHCDAALQLNLTFKTAVCNIRGCSEPLQNTNVHTPSCCVRAGTGVCTSPETGADVCTQTAVPKASLLHQQIYRRLPSDRQTNTDTHAILQQHKRTLCFIRR